MAPVEWTLVLLLMVPALLFCWAVVKSGVIQRTRDQLGALRPVVRHRVWTMLLVMIVVATAMGAALVWAFSTNHAVLGLAVLVGFVLLDGIATPLLRTRRIQRKSASAPRETKKPQ